MTLQAVRAHFEDPIRAAAAALTPPVPVYFDNQQFVEANSPEEFIKMRLDFGTTTEATLCENAENLRGSIALEIFTPKGKGPGRSQRVATDLMKALNTITSTRHAGKTVRGSVREMTGPNFFALDGRPHFFARLGCGFQASYTGP